MEIATRICKFCGDVTEKEFPKLVVRLDFLPVSKVKTK